MDERKAFVRLSNGKICCLPDLVNVLIGEDISQTRSDGSQHVVVTGQVDQ